jgi:DNA-directed RNA polymerase omega subunit
MAKREKKKKKKKKQPVEEAADRRETREINPEMPVEQQVPLNELPTLFPNAYEAVVVAARRARQLNLGLRPLVNTHMYRPVDIALAELAAGKIEYSTVSEDAGLEAGGKKGKSRSK